MVTLLYGKAHKLQIKLHGVLRGPEQPKRRSYSSLWLISKNQLPIASLASLFLWGKELDMVVSEVARYFHNGRDRILI